MSQREFLAKLFVLPLVRANVDRLSEAERFIGPVPHLLNRLGPAIGSIRFARALGLTLLPYQRNTSFLIRRM